MIMLHSTCFPDVRSMTAGSELWAARFMGRGRFFGAAIKSDNSEWHTTSERLIVKHTPPPATPAVHRLDRFCLFNPIETDTERALKIIKISVCAIIEFINFTFLNIQLNLSRFSGRTKYAKNQFAVKPYAAATSLHLHIKYWVYANENHVIKFYNIPATNSCGIDR